MLKAVNQAIIGAGSYSVIIGNLWYHYHHGMFVCDPIEKLCRMGGFWIKSFHVASRKEIEYVKSLLGSEWSLFSNCARLKAL